MSLCSPHSHLNYFTFPGYGMHRPKSMCKRFAFLGTQMTYQPRDRHHISRWGIARDALNTFIVPMVRESGNRGRTQVQTVEEAEGWLILQAVTGRQVGTEINEKQGWTEKGWTEMGSPRNENSVIIYSPPSPWKVRWSFFFHKTTRCCSHSLYNK